MITLPLISFIVVFVVMALMRDHFSPAIIVPLAVVIGALIGFLFEGPI